MGALRRSFFSASIESFLVALPESVLGRLVGANHYDLDLTQRTAWEAQCFILRDVLAKYKGRGGLLFEYSIPRLGKRIDVLLIVDHVVFVLEFKVGQSLFSRTDIEQVWDYALDLKNFHEPSRSCHIVPILVATQAAEGRSKLVWSDDQVAVPLCAAPAEIAAWMDAALVNTSGSPIDWQQWEAGTYAPTPTIVEAAKALYAAHSVQELSRQDARRRPLRQSFDARAKARRRPSAL
jgi:hypothetical protein